MIFFFFKNSSREAHPSFMRIILTQLGKARHPLAEATKMILGHPYFVGEGV